MLKLRAATEPRELAETLGLETLAGFTPLLSDGTRLPACFEERFSTGADNQPDVQLLFRAGSAEKHRPLAVLIVEVGVRAPRGVPRLVVRVEVGEDGTAHVTSTNHETATVRRAKLGRLAVRPDMPRSAPHDRPAANPPMHPTDSAGG